MFRFMNKLLEASGAKKISFKDKPKQAFAAMNNIEQFNKACQEYGVPTTATFQVSPPGILQWLVSQILVFRNRKKTHKGGFCKGSHVVINNKYHKIITSLLSCVKTFVNIL